jgi:hypothetical protein
MNAKEYVTKEEVRQVCKNLGIRDWTKLTTERVPAREAKIILEKVNVKKMPIELEDFRRGLEVELEHGIRFEDANVTNNHPILTGMIVLAHLKESLDYYKHLEIAEIEGDMFKAIKSKNTGKLQKYYKKLCEAKKKLAMAEARQLR